MTRIRGLTYLRHDKADYCPKCGLWGQCELWQSYLTKIYTVGSVLHREYIAGYQFTIKRCWY